MLTKEEASGISCRRKGLSELVDNYEYKEV